MTTHDKLPTYYSAGTASVVSGQTAITLTGAAWYSAVWSDDLFYLPSQPLVPPQRIEQVNPDGSAVLAYPWPGATATDVTYEVRYVGMIERSTFQSRRVLEQLGDVKAWADVFVDTDADRLALETATNPLPAGRRVMVIGTGMIWVKRTTAYNDWRPPAAFRGDAGPIGPTGPRGVTWRGGYNAATAYAKDDGVLQNGSSWIALQATTGNAPPTLPTTSNAYWELMAQRGQDGTGTGDVVGPASSVAARIAVFSDGTGKSLADSGLTIAELAPADNSITNAKLADMASGTLKGRVAAGLGDPEDLTATQLLNLLKTVGAYAKDNILGTVAQAAGIPTGAIFERGSNANGEYVRFADGTQIVTQERSLGTVAITSANGNTFFSANQGGAAYPANFSIAPAVSAMVENSTGLSWVTLGVSSSTTTSPGLFLSSGASQSPTGNILRFLAIGRWF